MARQLAETFAASVGLALGRAPRPAEQPGVERDTPDQDRTRKPRSHGRGLAAAAAAGLIGLLLLLLPGGRHHDQPTAAPAHHAPAAPDRGGGGLVTVIGVQVVPSHVHVSFVVASSSTPLPPNSTVTRRFGSYASAGRLRWPGLAPPRNYDDLDF